MLEQRTVAPARTLRGAIAVPGDKSISHRSIMLGSLAAGTTVVRGFLHGEDNHATLKAFRAMGIEIVEEADRTLRIAGQGLDGLQEPADVLDCGNSGATIRLMTGLLAGQRFADHRRGSTNGRTGSEDGHVGVTDIPRQVAGLHANAVFSRD